MKTKIFLLFAVTLLISLYSCSKEETPPTKQEPSKNEEPDDPGLIDGNNVYSYLAPHYLLTFYQPKEFSAWIRSEANITLSVAKYGGYYSWWSVSPKEKAVYETLCARYNDLTYDKKRENVDYYQGGYDYLADNIVSINVMSGTDYDEAHPAGTSLNDLCILASASPREHIAGGYTKTYDWEVNPENFDPSFEWIFHSHSDGSIPFSKPLVECTPEDMVLMGSGDDVLCLIRFISKPTSGLKQHYMVTLTDEKGAIYTVASTNIGEL